MKVGTDAVLLGAWVKPDAARHILDIGTGSGVIALMMAQRSDATTRIDAIDVSGEEAEQADENFKHSPWSSKLRTHACSIQTFESLDLYDLIVTNPPYFEKSLKPEHQARSRARHTESLSFDELLKAVDRLLDKDGRFCVVLPANAGQTFAISAAGYSLWCSRRTEFKTRAHKTAERILMEFTRTRVHTMTTTLVLYAEGNIWSAEYLGMTEDFYLQR